MGKDKTGRPVDVPIGSGLNVTGQDFARRRPIVPPGGVTHIYSTMIKQTFITNTYNYTLTNEVVLLVDASSLDVVVNLPAASGKAHKVYYIKKTDDSRHTVTIKGNAKAETIDNEEEYTISVPYTCITVLCDGDDWWII